LFSLAVCWVWDVPFVSSVFSLLRGAAVVGLFSVGSSLLPVSVSGAAASAGYFYFVSFPAGVLDSAMLKTKQKGLHDVCVLYIMDSVALDFNYIQFMINSFSPGEFMINWTSGIACFDLSTFNFLFCIYV
jgi:hypothetical protein